MIRRTWPVLLSLAISGGVAGTAIAGLPDSGPDAIVVLAPTSITGLASPEIPIVASEAPVVSEPVASGAPDAPVASEPGLDVVVAPTDAVPQPTDTTVVATPVIGSPVVTAGADDPNLMIDRQHIELLIVNGDGSRANLAMSGAGRMSAAGYTQFVISDQLLSADITTVYYQPGFDDEAWMVSGDLLMPAAPLAAMPAEGVTNNVAQADIVIVLGADYVA